MIRVLLGSALPVLGIGAAATFVSPALLTGPRGEPLVMVAPGEASLQAASYDGDACASTLFFANPSDDSGAPPNSGTRIVAFALASGPNDVAVAVEDFASAPAEPRTVVLVFDEAGRLVAAGDPNSLHIQAIAGLDDCINPPEADVRKPI